MTDEPAELVNDWIAKAKPKYPIATLRGGLESFLQVKGYPSCAVIDAEGVVQYSGYVGMEEGALGDSLGKTKKKSLWPKSLSKITKLMQGEPAKAYAALKELGEVGEEERSLVVSFTAYLEAQASGQLTLARGYKEAGFVLKAARAIEAYADVDPPFPSSADSAQLLQDLEASSDFKKELAGGKAYDEAEALEKSKEYLDAFDAYKSISKKYSGTRIAENARAQAESLRTDGLPGFVSACKDCYEGKRACEKHHKEVKL